MFLLGSIVLALASPAPLAAYQFAVAPPSTHGVSCSTVTVRANGRPLKISASTPVAGGGCSIAISGGAHLKASALRAMSGRTKLAISHFGPAYTVHMSQPANTAAMPRAGIAATTAPSP